MVWDYFESESGEMARKIESVTPIIVPMGIACGLARIFILSSFLGWLSFGILFGIGKVLIED